MLRSFLIALVLITTPQAFATQLTHAAVVQHDGSRGMAATLRQLAASAKPVWIAWDEPTADPKSSMCCFESIDAGDKSHWRGGRCSLADRRNGFSIGDNGAMPAVNRTTFSIFARAANGVVEELRLFSEDCAVDGEGLTVHYLTNVAPADSITWLEAYAQEESTRTKKDSHEAAAAIATHRGPQAIDALERLVTRAQSTSVRANAAFWLGHRGGTRGRQILRGVIDQADSHQLIDQAIAGIAQDDAREATDLLLSLAKTHRSPQVRKQSIFWLGQRAGEKATEHLKEAADDPDQEVREMAVFSISQLPRDQGIPELIRLARTHKNRGVREKAIFWLGQSGDPRALEYIEEVLTK
ncbi:MAG: hypothetical protein QOH21_3062 [Acidobacteriota bacterium]|jgi:hypothetical protein|nr:hypothetical protein [Acidobacteriota bacterium]